MLAPEIARHIIKHVASSQECQDLEVDVLNGKEQYLNNTPQVSPCLKVVVFFSTEMVKVMLTTFKHNKVAQGFFKNTMK